MASYVTEVPTAALTDYTSPAYHDYSNTMITQKTVDLIGEEFIKKESEGGLHHNNNNSSSMVGSHQQVVSLPSLTYSTTSIPTITSIGGVNGTEEQGVLYYSLEELSKYIPENLNFDLGDGMVTDSGGAAGSTMTCMEGSDLQLTGGGAGSNTHAKNMTIALPHIGPTHSFQIQLRTSGSSAGGVQTLTIPTIDTTKLAGQLSVVQELPEVSKLVLQEIKSEATANGDHIVNILETMKEEENSLSPLDYTVTSLPNCESPLNLVSTTAPAVAHHHHSQQPPQHQHTAGGGAQVQSKGVKRLIQGPIVGGQSGGPSGFGDLDMLDMDSIHSGKRLKGQQQQQQHLVVLQNGQIVNAQQIGTGSGFSSMKTLPLDCIDTLDGQTCYMTNSHNDLMGMEVAAPTPAQPSQMTPPGHQAASAATGVVKNETQMFLVAEPASSNKASRSTSKQQSSQSGSGVTSTPASKGVSSGTIIPSSKTCNWVFENGQMCGKTFSKSYNLVVHMRMHEDIRPFACTLCDQTFRQKAHLQRHETTHGIPSKNFYRTPQGGAGNNASGNGKRKRGNRGKSQSGRNANRLANADGSTHPKLLCDNSEGEECNMEDGEDDLYIPEGSSQMETMNNRNNKLKGHNGNKLNGMRMVGKQQEDMEACKQGEDKELDSEPMGCSSGQLMDSSMRSKMEWMNSCSPSAQPDDDKSDKQKLLVGNSDAAEFKGIKEEQNGDIFSNGGQGVIRRNDFRVAKPGEVQSGMQHPLNLAYNSDKTIYQRLDQLDDDTSTVENILHTVNSVPTLEQKLESSYLSDPDLMVKMPTNQQSNNNNSLLVADNNGINVKGSVKVMGNIARLVETTHPISGLSTISLTPSVSTNSHVFTQPPAGPAHHIPVISQIYTSQPQHGQVVSNSAQTNILYTTLANPITATTNSKQSIKQQVFSIMDPSGNQAQIALGRSNQLVIENLDDHSPEFQAELLNALLADEENVGQHQTAGQQFQYQVVNREPESDLEDDFEEVYRLNTLPHTWWVSRRKVRQFQDTHNIVYDITYYSQEGYGFKTRSEVQAFLQHDIVSREAKLAGLRFPPIPLEDIPMIEDDLSYSISHPAPTTTPLTSTELPPPHCSRLSTVVGPQPPHHPQLQPMDANSIAQALIANLKPEPIENLPESLITGTSAAAAAAAASAASANSRQLPRVSEADMTVTFAPQEAVKGDFVSAQQPLYTNTSITSPAAQGDISSDCLLEKNLACVAASDLSSSTSVAPPPDLIDEVTSIASDDAMGLVGDGRGVPNKMVVGNNCVDEAGNPTRAASSLSESMSASGDGGGHVEGPPEAFCAGDGQQQS